MASSELTQKGPLSMTERRPRRTGPGPIRRASPGHPPGWSLGGAAPPTWNHMGQGLSKVSQGCERRYGAVGGLPGKPGSGKALPEKHRWLTALVSCSTLGLPRWGGGHGWAGAEPGLEPRAHRAAQTPSCGFKDQRPLPGCSLPLRKPPAGPTGFPLVRMAGADPLPQPWPRSRRWSHIRVSVFRVSVSIIGVWPQYPFISCSVARHLGNRSSPPRPGPRGGGRGLSCPFSEASFSVDRRDLPFLLWLALG